MTESLDQYIERIKSIFDDTVNKIMPDGAEGRRDTSSVFGVESHNTELYGRNGREYSLKCNFQNRTSSGDIYDRKVSEFNARGFYAFSEFKYSRLAMSYGSSFDTVVDSVDHTVSELLAFHESEDSLKSSASLQTVKQQLPTIENGGSFKYRINNSDGTLDYTLEKISDSFDRKDSYRLSYEKKNSDFDYTDMVDLTINRTSKSIPLLDVLEELEKGDFFKHFSD